MGNSLSRCSRAQFEELLPHPRFEAQDASGNLVDAKEWGAGTNLGHLGAIEFLFGPGREVAIKILPEAFAQDADRPTRFQREAQVLAALNHPDIAGI